MAEARAEADVGARGSRHRGRCRGSCDRGAGRRWKSQSRPSQDRSCCRRREACIRPTRTAGHVARRQRTPKFCPGQPHHAASRRPGERRQVSLARAKIRYGFGGSTPQSPSRRRTSSRRRRYRVRPGAAHRAPGVIRPPRLPGGLSRGSECASGRGRTLHPLARGRVMTRSADDPASAPVISRERPARPMDFPWQPSLP